MFHCNFIYEKVSFVYFLTLANQSDNLDSLSSFVFQASLNVGLLKHSSLIENMFILIFEGNNIISYITRSNAVTVFGDDHTL